MIEREMPYRPEKIWGVLTQGELMKKWLMENGFHPAVGHKFSFRTTPVPNWNDVIDCEVLSMEQSDFRPDQEAVYRGATYGWQKFIGSLEKVVAGLK